MAWDESARYWQYRKKHLPLPNHEWQKVVEWTRNDAARYKLGLPMEIEQIEMECVRTGNEMRRDRRVTVKRYWKEFDFVVGASEGMETKYVYAEWHSTNAVHGRPITLDELHRKGAGL